MLLLRSISVCCETVKSQLRVPQNYEYIKCVTLWLLSVSYEDACITLSCKLSYSNLVKDIIKYVALTILKVILDPFEGKLGAATAAG